MTRTKDTHPSTPGAASHPLATIRPLLLLLDRRREARFQGACIATHRAVTRHPARLAPPAPPAFLAPLAPRNTHAAYKELTHRQGAVPEDREARRVHQAAKVHLDRQEGGPEGRLDRPDLQDLRALLALQHITLRERQDYGSKKS